MAIAAKSIEVIDIEASEADGVFTATIKWRLAIHVNQMTSINDALPELVAAEFGNQLPKQGAEYHEGRPLCTCRSVSCKRDGVNGLYVYTAKYSDENSDPESQEKAVNDNPLLDRPVIKPTGGIQPIAIHRDRDDHAILNAAGDPIIEQRDENVIGFSVQANVANVPWEILTYRNSTNDAPFTIDGLTVGTNMARFILPSDWKSEYKFRNDVRYVVFKYELLIDERDLHYGRPLNAGFRERVPRYELDENGEPTTTQQRRIVYELDENGNPTTTQATDSNGDPIFGELLWDKRIITEEDGSEVQQPVPLTEDGVRVDDPTPELSNFLTVKKYYEQDFLVLPGLAAPE